MNNIIIDKNYSVIADGNGCTLVFVGEPYIKKGKNVTPRDRWYYNNIEQCLKKYVQESLEKDTYKNWKYHGAFTLRDIEAGEEITLDYTKELCGKIDYGDLNWLKYE